MKLGATRCRGPAAVHPMFYSLQVTEPRFWTQSPKSWAQVRNQFIYYLRLPRKGPVVSSLECFLMFTLGKALRTFLRSKDDRKMPSTIFQTLKACKAVLLKWEGTFSSSRWKHDCRSLEQRETQCLVSPLWWQVLRPRCMRDDVVPHHTLTIVSVGLSQAVIITN